MKIIGTKYQIYEDSELKIYRVLEYKNSKITLVDEKDHKTVKKVREQELLDKYIRLIPDAFMNIMITDHNDNPDVYACVNKSDKLSIGKTTPEIIVRQSLYHVLNLTSNAIIFGECLSEQSDISNGDLASYMEFKNIDYATSVALYVDDTVDSIIDTIDEDVLKRLDNELSYIKKKYGQSETYKIEGYVETFKDLLNHTSFISHYRAIFNILQVNWPVDLGKESYNSNGDLILNSKQKHMIEDHLRKFITNIKIIKYDKDIDINKIVSLPHMMISDTNEIIYLIAYDVISDYPVDPDIATAMAV